MPIALCGVAWGAALLAAHFAGRRTREALACLALAGPLLGALLFALIFVAYKRLHNHDKDLFGAAIAAYSAGVLAALELAARGGPRAPWLLLLLADLSLFVLGLLAVVVAGSGAAH